MNASESEPSRPASGLQVELSAKSRRHLPTFWIFLPLAALVAAGIWSITLVANRQVVSLSSPVSPAATIEAVGKPAPTVTWSENPLDVILSLGETASRTLTLTTDRKVGKLRLCVSSTLAPFLTLNVLDKHDVEDEAEEDDALKPVEREDDELLDKKGCKGERFKLNPRKAPQSVELTFTIPASTPFGTYEGTIEIWRGKRTLPQTLKVTMNTWQLFVDRDFGVSLKYPPGWIVGGPEDNVVSLSRTISPDTSGDFAGDVVIFRDTNLSRLPLEDYYRHFRGGYLYQDSAAAIPITVASLQGIRFTPAAGLFGGDVVVLPIRVDQFLRIEDRGTSLSFDSILGTISQN